MMPLRIGLAAAALVLLAAGGARADETARCTVRTIHATPDEGGVDPQLADLRAQLTRPPFTSWKSFKLLASHQAELTPGAASRFPLPEERQGTLTYKQHLQPEGGRHRVRLQLEVRRGGESQLSTVFVLDEGGTVLSAGSKHGGGILILGVSCSTGA